MEEKDKYFKVVAAEGIRNFVAELNAKGLTKDDIVDTYHNPSSGTYYALIYV